MELIASAYAAEIRGIVAEMGRGAAEAYKSVRDRVAPFDDERELGADTARIAEMIASG